MPAVPIAVLESSSDDSLELLNDEYHDGEWAVVNLASLQSIPMSDFSHTPYDQQSAFLDTASAISAASQRLSAATRASITPVMPPISSRRLQRRELRASGARDASSVPASPVVVTSPRLVGDRATAFAGRDAQHVLQTLVKRELDKRDSTTGSVQADLCASSPTAAPAADADKLTTPPTDATSSPTGAPDTVTREEGQASGESRAVRRTNRAGSAGARRGQLRRSSQQLAMFPVPPPEATVPKLAPPSSRRVPAPPVLPPVAVEPKADAESEDTTATTSTLPETSLSLLSDAGDDKRTNNSSRRRPLPWRREQRQPQEQFSPRQASNGDPDTFVRNELAQFAPLLSQRGDESSAVAAHSEETDGGDEQRVGAHPTVLETSARHTARRLPSSDRATPVDSSAARATPKFVRSPPEENISSDATTALTESSEGRTRASHEKKRKPLSLPLPPERAVLTATPPESPTPSQASARQRAATASQEHLIAFVRAVSDPEVLYVIHDYICEKKNERSYREAARICLELLQQKEKLLEDTENPRRSSVAAPAHRAMHAVLADDTEEKPGAAEQSLTDSEDVEDEFGDLDCSPSAYPEAPTQFQFGQPTVSGAATRVFKEGMLFKVKDAKGDYYFYNDTLSQVMMLRASCVLLGNEQINDRAILTPIEGTTGTEITIAVLPEETNFFMGNVKRLPRIAARAVPVPEDFTSSAVTAFVTRMSAGINKVRASLGRWDRATDQKAYLKCCLKCNLKFTDLAFRPGARSLFRPHVDLVKVPPLTWRRPEEYLAITEVSEARLFRGEISCHLVKQGELSDHTVVAAIAAIAEFPHHVMWMFRHPVSGENGKRERAIGCYRVTLLRHGWWTNIVLDSYLPASVHGPLFAHCPRDPRRLWVPMLEKAYAKALGSYSATCLADVMETITNFTGFPTRRIEQQWQLAQDKPTDAAASSLFRYLQRCTTNGYIVVLYTPAESDEQSTNAAALSRRRSHRIIPVDGCVPQFLPGHVYFLTETAFYKELDLRMVRLKNPWTWETKTSQRTAEKQWKYTGWYQQPDMSFTSAALGASLAGSLRGASVAAPPRTDAASEERKGTMWLEWEEALKAFSGGGVCYSLWHYTHVRVRNAFTSGFPDFVLEVTPAEKRTELFVTLTVGDPRDVDGDDNGARAPTALPHSAGGADGLAGDAASGEPSELLCGVTLTVTKHARAVGAVGAGRAGGRPGDAGIEEICCRACEDIECLGARVTYVKERSTSLKVTLDPSNGPYHVIPQLDPDSTQLLRARGERRMPFVVSILASAPIGVAGGLGVAFKRIPRACPVYEGSETKFALSSGPPCTYVEARYQCMDERGVTTLTGQRVVPPQ